MMLPPVCFGAIVIAVMVSSSKAIPSSSAKSAASSDRNRSEYLLWPRGRQFQTENMDLSGFYYDGPYRRRVLMVNGTSEDILTFPFRPERGKVPSDYKFTFASNNTEILDPDTDISFAQIEIESMVNITAAIDFNKFPGVERLTLEARRIADDSVFDTVSVDYLAAGIAIYNSQNRSLITGAGQGLRIPSYEDLHKEPHMDFDVFIQYLNGTDSLHILEHPNPIPSFTTSGIMFTFGRYEGQVQWDDDICSLTGADWDGRHVILNQGCGIGFAAGKVNNSHFDGFHFGFDFEKNRAGQLEIVFEWDDFTMFSEFEDELFTNYINTEILGQPPVVVKAIEPETTFDQNGDQELYVEMINTADVNITSFNVNGIQFPLISGSRQHFSNPPDFFESAKFLTKPGKGRRLSWTISGTRKKLVAGGDEIIEVATITDETGFLFSYDGVDVYVENISPSSVSERGGDRVVVSGNFTAFDANNPNHGVLVGSNSLDRSRLTETSPSSIEFKSPKRQEIGSGWEYDVVVRIENSFSQPVTLGYEPTALTAHQQVFGASLEPDTGVHTVSSCGNSTYMAVLQNYNGDDAVYIWKLLNSFEVDLLSLENATSLVKEEHSLDLPNEFLPHFNKIYHLVAEISVGNLSTTSVFLVQRTENVVVGVNLIQPENRTIASPAVNMRIVAKVDIPDCYPETPTLTYEWEYEDKEQTLLDADKEGIDQLSVHDSELKPHFHKYVFSSKNRSGTIDGKITPTRLGRELVIPREELRHGIHRVRLTVRSDKDARLIGTSGASVTIAEDELRALIGTGQASRRASDAEDLYISAQGSTDPDIIAGGSPSSGLAYEWTCLFSRNLNLSSAEKCSDNLLPANAKNISSFSVPREILQNYSSLATDDIEGEVYLRYTLRVRKGNRSGTASQTIAVVSSGGLRLAGYERIELLNSLGERLDHRAVPFWDEVIIRPVTSLNTEWRFRLEEPLHEKRTFFAGGSRLISSPGYYSVAGRSDPGFQRLQLGIKTDQLSPNQDYSFSITLQEPGKLSDEVLISFHTVEVPSIIFPNIASSSGTVNTTFKASATTSFSANSSYSFQFYLIEQGKRTREYCVDGCTGASTVRFQVPKPGFYTVQCRLFCASGKKLLAVKNNTAVLSVIASDSARKVDQFDKEMDRDYILGDDGSVNQKGFFITESMHEENDTAVAISDDPSNDLCANYTRKWARMSRVIVGNELPNTANARNYVSLASNFARLKCVEDADTLYELLGMVDESISRTPSEETLTTTAYSGQRDLPNVQLEEELLRFYNFSMNRALSSVAGGSSRGRLVPVEGAVNNLVLDLSEMWMTHITASATSGRVCGWDATYTSSSVDGEPDSSLTPSRSEPPLGVNTIRVAVMCNREQGTSLSTPFASFEWCDSIYDFSSSERILITVAEFFDYPYLSGVQGTNRSDSRRLVMVDITTLGESNRLVSAMSDSAVVAQTESEDENVEACYRIRLTMGSEAMTRSDECSRNVPYHMWPRKAYGKSLSEPFQNGAYQRRTAGVKVTPETRNDSATVIAKSNILGLYGAYRTTCDTSAPISLGGVGLTLVGLMLGITLAILAIIGLTYGLITTLVGVAVVSDDEEEILENYVERDFFGRGQVRLNMVRDSEDGSSASDDSSAANLSELPVEGDFVEEMDSISDRVGSAVLSTRGDLTPRSPKEGR